jgi:thiosulfate dehydrogenase [quinone] large subunit
VSKNRDLFAGWAFLSSGLAKWRAGFDETAVTGYLQGALSKTSSALLAAKGPAAAAHPDVTNTWAWVINNIFLPNAGLLAWLVKFGEVAIGLALIIGLFTHLAAGLGSLMCFIYLLSGTASITGPLLLSFLIIFWLGSDSYLFGADRFFMNKLVKDHPTLNSDTMHPFFPAYSYKRIPEKYKD